jgi:phosphoglycolate phosphatase
VIELCVFDLDGTLVNSLEDLANSTNYALIKNGFKAWEVENYRYFVGDGVLMLIKRALAEKGTEEAEKTVYNDFNEYYDKHYVDCTRPYEGITELLKELREKRVKCAVLSNKPDSFVKIIMEELFPDFEFSWIQGKLEEFPKKPDPAALNFILDKLNAKKESTLYIGDSNVDVFTGKNAGLKTCGVLWGFRGREELEAAGADHVVSEPKEILKLCN